MRVGQFLRCTTLVAVMGSACLAQSNASSGTQQDTPQQSVDQQSTDENQNTDVEMQSTPQRSVNPESMGQNQTDNSDANLNGQRDRRWANYNDSDRDSRRRALIERDKLTHALQQQS